MLPKILLPLLALLFALSARAEPCVDLKTCAKVMFDLYGQRYVWDNKDEGKFGSSPDVELTKENGELVFTALLDQLGLARAPVGDGKTYRVVRSPYRKEMNVPIVEASADVKPELPITWDWYMMRYKTRNADEPSYIESAFRLHLPREARMQADDNTGVLIVEGPAPLVRHMYEMIKGADHPLTAATKQKERERLADFHASLNKANLAAPAPAVQPVPPPPKR